MTTVNEVVNWAKDLANKGHGVDYDGAYGKQCVDLPNWVLGKFFGKSIWGNAIDLLTSARQAGYTVISDAPGVNPKAGDLFVMQTYAHIYGHTGIVLEDSDGYTLKTIEQNVDGNADALIVGGPARYVTRRFNQGDGKVIGWIRPPYNDQSVVKEAEVFNGKLKDERGTFTVNVALLNVRDQPSAKGKVVAQYGKGMTINYDSVYIADGYVWVSYIGGSGARRYIACGVAKGRINVAPYGSFK